MPTLHSRGTQSEYGLETQAESVRGSPTPLQANVAANTLLYRAGLEHFTAQAGLSQRHITTCPYLQTGHNASLRSALYSQFNCHVTPTGPRSQLHAHSLCYKKL